jgi:predicted  nucleic acid-binding Zn-ribbon protein
MTDREMYVALRQELMKANRRNAELEVEAGKLRAALSALRSEAKDHDTINEGDVSREMTRRGLTLDDW